MRSNRRTRRGIAFLLALIATLVAMVLLAGATAQMTANAKKRVSTDEAKIAEDAALAAVQYSIANITDFNPSLLQPQTDTWATLGDTGQTSFHLAHSSFRIQIVDAGSLVNLNKATLTQLESMGFTEDQAGAIEDWRTPGLLASSPGAKDETYNALNFPYNTALRDFNSVSELLLVNEVDAKTLLLAPTDTSAQVLSNNGVQQAPLQLLTVESQCGNTSATGGRLTDIQTVSTVQLQRSGIPIQVATSIVAQRTRTPFTSMGQVLRTPGMTMAAARALLNGYTVGGATTETGRINLNTASEAVLTSIDALNANSSVVQTIVANNGAYTSLGDLTTVAGLSLNDVASLADTFTVGSQVMVVRALGTAGSTNVAIEATLDMTTTPPHIRRIEHVLYPDPFAFWGWNVDTTSDQTLTTDQTAEASK